MFADSSVTSCDAVHVLRGVAVHGIHEVWPFPSLKILPVCGPRPGFRVAVLHDLVCAYLDGFLVVNVAVFGAVRRRYVTSIIAPLVARLIWSRLVES